MLDPEQIDLADLALALEDHSPEHSWWFDPASGEVETSFALTLPGAAVDGHDALRLLPIEPLPTDVGYGDMEDFVSYVCDPRARDLLERAIVGRGAFRRFKDTLMGFPELRQAWFAFHDARGERRAIEWLVEQRLVSSSDAEEALARCSDPEHVDFPGLLDAHGLARRVARDLRRMYRKRLKAVLLIGPWARGEARPESPVELLVVLDVVSDRWTEKRRMDPIMWRHSIRNDAVVTEIPVTATELEHAATPLLTRAIVEGVRVA
jgi:hypothetical protein